MPITNGIFQRVWRFVDRFQAGEDITRSDLDVAFDDMASGVNHYLQDSGLSDLQTLLADDGSTAAIIADIRDTLLLNIAMQARDLTRRVEDLTND